MSYFSVQKIIFSWYGYDMSYIELFGSFFGLWAVVLSTQEKVSSWYIGILNVLLSFFMFYQIQLYSDMLLQVYFLATNLMGWYLWTHPKKGLENKDNQLKISNLRNKEKIIYSVTIFSATVICGFLIGHIHELFPLFFQKPAAFPYWDTFVMVASIVAQYLLTKKKLDAWLLWIAVDVVATVIYFQKGILLYSVEYFIFCAVAAYGFWKWKTAAKSSSELGDLPT
jgi:nicotinamide mononucleotide transporter